MLMNNKHNIEIKVREYENRLKASRDILNRKYFSQKVKNDAYDQMLICSAYYKHYKEQLDLIVLMENLEKDYIYKEIDFG